MAGVVAIAIERAEFLAERDAAALLRQKADLAATLLASLSHDLRTPLTAIRVAVENLRGELPADERRAQSSAAMAELERLETIVRSVRKKLDNGTDSIDGCGIPNWLRDIKCVTEFA